MRGVCLALLPLLALSLKSASAEQISLEREHGVYMVPVRINEAVSIPFVLDSGASEVAIPADVFMTLLRSRSVTENDFIGEGIFVTADGTKHKSEQFILREVQAGTHVIADVVANVVPIEGDPLLGRVFSLCLPSWSIDNNSHVLNLATGETNELPRNTPRIKLAGPVATGDPPRVGPSALRHATADELRFDSRQRDRSSMVRRA